MTPIIRLIMGRPGGTQSYPIVPLKYIEYGFGYIIIRSPYTPYSVYLGGTIHWDLSYPQLASFPTLTPDLEAGTPILLGLNMVNIWEYNIRGLFIKDYLPLFPAGNP